MMELKKSILSLCCLAALNANAYYGTSGQIYDDSDQLIEVNGVSWSGFQDTNILQGLQNNPFLAIPHHPYQPKQSGMLDTLVNSNNQAQFKTIRLPIQPGVLYDDTNQVDLNKSLTNKAYPLEGNGIFCKSWEANGSACSQAVSSKEALWLVLSELKKKNIKVLIDFHHRYGYGDGYRDGTVYDMQQYAKDLKLLAQEIKSRNLDNVIGIDIFNEPYQLNWFQAQNNQVAWTKVIAVAANVISTELPNVMLFVEGPNGGNNDADNPVICVSPDKIVDDPNGYSHSSDPQLCGNLHRLFLKGNWGEDFKPLLNTAQAKLGVAQFDINKFQSELTKQGITVQAMQWLLGNSSNEKSHIVFSPHVYPAEVATWETSPGQASNLRFDWTWGFLHKAGYPVVLGEASWKTSQGKAFFTQAVMPYLAQQNIGTNNVFFWAIGFLGDTVTAIDPQTGELNSDVQTTLAPYFGAATPTGTVNLTFLQNVQFSGAVPVTIQGEQYTGEQSCSLANGCQVRLPEGSYQITVPAQYKYNDAEKAVYKLATQSSLQLEVKSNHVIQQQLVIASTIATHVLPQPVKFTVALLDDAGHQVGLDPNSNRTISITDKSDPSQKLSCQLQDKTCSINLFNTNINAQGEFGDKQYTLEAPSNLTGEDGQQYKLETSLNDIQLTGNNSQTVYRNLNYQQSTQQPPTSGSCQASLRVDNFWGSGAVLQGKIINSGDKAIKHFTITVSFENSPGQVVSAWVGNNTSYQLNGSSLALEADTYDNYNGLLPSQVQTYGFQIQGVYAKAPKVMSVSCQ